MPKRDRHVQTLAQLFRIVGDQTRLNILMVLQDGEFNVSVLCKKLKMAQPTVSHHLGILRMGGLVNHRRNGKEIFYSLPDESQDKLQSSLQIMLKQQAAIRIGPLLLGMVKN